MAIATLLAAALLPTLPTLPARSQQPSAPSAPQPPQATPIEIHARTIDRFFRAQPEQQRFGRLRFRGGLVLTSPATEFGGYSAIALAPNGRRLVAVSDEGTWLSGDLAYEDTRPSELTGAVFGPLLGLRGRRLDRKRDLDAESMAVLDGTLDRGTLLIGLERNHRIGIFPIGPQGIAAPTGFLRLPPQARHMRSNGGLEAVAVIRGGPNRGAVIAFAERLLDGQGNHTGWIWLQGNPHRLSLRNIGDFDITDAASLPDGSLLVLERFFRISEGVKMRLRLIKAANLQPGALLDGEVLLEADGRYEIDNMEGLAVHQGARGETVLTIVSDNNFNTFLQRTLLLQFELAPTAGKD